MKIFIISILCFSLCKITYSQEMETVSGQGSEAALNANSNIWNYNKASIGLGIGLDHGGFGLNFSFYPQQNVGIIGGFGYAIADLGYNVGAKFRLTPQKKAPVTPFMMGMYGYNTVITVKNASNFDKIFYGMSLGFGFDAWSRNNISCWSFGLIVPVRDPEVQDYMDDLKNNHNIIFTQDLFPVLITVGFKINLN